MAPRIGQFHVLHHVIPWSFSLPSPTFIISCSLPLPGNNAVRDRAGIIDGFRIGLGAVTWCRCDFSHQWEETICYRLQATNKKIEHLILGDLIVEISGGKSFIDPFGVRIQGRFLTCESLFFAAETLNLDLQMSGTILEIHVFFFQLAKRTPPNEVHEFPRNFRKFGPSKSRGRGGKHKSDVKLHHCWSLTLNTSMSQTTFSIWDHGYIYILVYNIWYDII